MQTNERHLGRNVSRIRELLGVKQESLAISLGMSQQSVSILEKNREMEKPKLEAIANALHVSLFAIENFDERKLLAYFENKEHDPVDEVASIGRNPLFHRLLQAYEMNSELHSEKQDLYERLLETEREKYRCLEMIVGLRNQNSTKP